VRHVDDFQPMRYCICDCDRMQYVTSLFSNKKSYASFGLVSISISLMTLNNTDLYTEHIAEYSKIVGRALSRRQPSLLFPLSALQ